MDIQIPGLRLFIRMERRSYSYLPLMETRKITMIIRIKNIVSKGIPISRHGSKNMNMTEDEFKILLSKNPNLKFTQQTGNQLPSLLEAPKSAKYHNQKVFEYEDDYISLKKDEHGHGKIKTVYDSLKEYARWYELKMLEHAGKITNLSRQVKWLIQESFVYRGQTVKAIYYKADFQYDTQDGITVVEDVKCFDKKKQKYLTTQAFDIKWKLLKRRYPNILFILY